MKKEIEAGGILGAMVGYVRQTRRYGQTYVHSAVRANVMGCNGVIGQINGREVKLTFGSWGNSIAYGGHKYKAHARWVDSGKPVPSKMLGLIARR